MDALRQELKSYVQRVHILEQEAKSLQKEKLATVALFEQAKNSWKKQALDHGEAQYKKGSGQKAVALYRQIQETERYAREALVYMAAAQTTLNLTDLTVLDFCLEDRHILVKNFTKSTLDLLSCSLAFRGKSSIPEFTFPKTSFMLRPNDAVSVWFGLNRTNLGNHAAGGSFHWNIDPKAVNPLDICELWRGMAVVSSIGSTESCASTTTVKSSYSSSTSKVGGKRMAEQVSEQPLKKRALTTSAKEPLLRPCLTSTDRRYGAVHLLRVEVSNSRYCKVVLENRSAERVVLSRSWKLLLFGGSLESDCTVSLGVQVTIPAESSVTLSDIPSKDSILCPAVGAFSAAAAGSALVSVIYLVDDLGCVVSFLNDDESIACLDVVGERDQRGVCCIQ